MYNILHREALLQNIAAGLNKYQEHKICDLEVTLYQEGDEVLRTSVSTCLDYIANDIYWDEENNWHAAEIAEVRVLC